MNIQFLACLSISSLRHTLEHRFVLFFLVYTYLTRTKAVESVISRTQRRPFFQLAVLDLSDGALLHRWQAGLRSGLSLLRPAAISVPKVLRMLICVDDGKLGLGLSLLWYKPTQCWSLVVVVEL
jgi:hypothetical protein